MKSKRSDTSSPSSVPYETAATKSTPPQESRDYGRIHREVAAYAQRLTTLLDLETIRQETLATVQSLIACEEIRFFLSREETLEEEVLEAFGSEQVRIRNRFASDQVLLAPIRGLPSSASGVIRLLNKLDWTAFSEEDAQILQSVITPLSLRLETLRLEAGMRSQVQSSIRALASTIEAKDRYTGGHTRRVRSYADTIAAELPLSVEDRERVSLAGLLHDIGKIGVPDRILLKPASLTEEEWEEMRLHTESGYDIVSRVHGLEDVAEILRHHHERWDGSGYPRRLQGESIPRSSRIIAVADAFDAMVTDRPYRRKMSPEEARERILELGGTQFDPEVVQAFLRAFETLKGLATNPV